MSKTHQDIRAFKLLVEIQSILAARQGPEWSSSPFEFDIDWPTPAIPGQSQPGGDSAKVLALSSLFSLICNRRTFQNLQIDSQPRNQTLSPLLLRPRKSRTPLSNYCFSLFIFLAYLLESPVGCPLPVAFLETLRQNRPLR